MPPPFDDETEQADADQRSDRPGDGSAIGARIDPELRSRSEDRPDPEGHAWQPTSGATSQGSPHGAPASFWRRLGAYVVDSLLISIPVSFLVEIILGRPFPADIDLGAPAETLELIWPFSAVAFALELVYFALMESSRWQATVGKHVLGMQVTDEQGERLSLLRAGMRNLGKLASALPVGLGFVLIFTSERNQALHDHIASCLVLEQASESAPQRSPNLEEPGDRWGG